MADRDDVAIARELGGLATAVKLASDRMTEDREQTGIRLDRLADGIESLDGRLHSLEQSSASTSAILTRMGRENAGVRLDRVEDLLFPVQKPSMEERIKSLESTINGWQRWMGSGKAFIVRAILVLMGTSAAWGFISQIFRGIAAKLGIMSAP